MPITNIQLYKVICSVRKTVRLIEQSGEPALGLNCDVTETTDICSALEKTIETFGRLDVAFNNAGIDYKTKNISDITEEEWDTIMDTAKQKTSTSNIPLVNQP